MGSTERAIIRKMPAAADYGPFFLPEIRCGA